MATLLKRLTADRRMLDISLSVKTTQKSVILGSARILKKVLETKSESWCASILRWKKACHQTVSKKNNNNNVKNAIVDILCLAPRVPITKGIAFVFIFHK